MTHASFRRFLALTVVAGIALAACSAGSSAAPILPPSGAPTQAPASTAPSPAAFCPEGAGLPAGCPTSPPAPMAADATATVTLATEKGDIVIAVKGSLGPLAAANFVALAECGAYDGTDFHRLVPGFVIQGGKVGTNGPGYQFADDPVTTQYLRGTVAMANGGPNTNGSQFFICLVDDTNNLAPSYSIFGTVTKGMDVVDAIAAMPNTGPPNNQAVNPVTITKATVTRP